MRTTFDRKRGLGFVGAFGGHGVVAANISGCTMRDLILNHRTDLTSLPWVGHHTRNWEPEPIRFIASRLIANTLDASDAYEERTGKPAKRLRVVAPFLPPKLATSTRVLDRVIGPSPFPLVLALAAASVDDARKRGHSDGRKRCHADRLDG